MWDLPNEDTVQRSFTRGMCCVEEIYRPKVSISKEQSPEGTKWEGMGRGLSQTRGQGAGIGTEEAQFWNQLAW
jgi:hypothetical protein